MACSFPAAFGELPVLTLLDLIMNDLTGMLHQEVLAGEPPAVPAVQCLKCCACCAVPPHPHPCDPGIASPRCGAVVQRLPNLQILLLAHTSLSLPGPTLSPRLHPSPGAVVQRLPNLQNLLLAHNRLGGRLTCDLVQGPLAELEVAGGWVGGCVAA